MKKIYYWSILILVMIAFLPQWAEAQSDTQCETHVTPAQALNVGYTFMRTGDGSKGNGTKNGNVSKQAMQLVYSGQATDSLTGAVTDCYYVFALQPKGFVIVAADDRVEPILGYSYDNDFVVETMPAHVRGWLGDYERQIEAVTKSDLQAEPATQTKWTRLKNGQAMSTKNSGDTTVGPLLTTTWDQGLYYNALCPEDAAGLDGHALTGCVATAMAQIINYWGSPVHGRGTHSYECNYGTLTVNYGSASYDYANMPNALTAASTTEEVNAVATLMRDCGVAANMGYGPSESSTYDVDARAGMINFFRLSPDMSYAERAYFTDTEWEDMLRADIDANRPVMYSGHGTGGHTFVCDGYKQDNYFHFNFGWGGYADGWYLTSTMTPVGMDFNSDQSAVFGIVPDSTGNVILGQMAGISTFVVDESLEFYHLLGHNAFHGMDFSQSFESTTNIMFADTSIPIVANLVNYGGDQSARVYYGNENDYHMIYPTMNWFPILESFNGTFSINYTGNWHYAGFCLQISKQDTCGILSYFDISSTVDTTQVVLSWLDRGNGSEWIIEYGEEGFEHGNGTVLSSNTNNITINNLLPLTYYDFYIKPVCSNSWTGPISMKTELSYWQDYVSEQPEGIEYNDDGYALVSTPEQLAWLVRENSNCEKILIVADIDLSGHRWKPVNGYPYYQGKEIDGNNHHISNLLVREDKYSLFNYIGFFGNLYPAYSMVFRDIIFDKPNIISERSVTRCGVLAGELRPVSSGQFIYTVINCGVNGGNINCSAFSAGGLIGGFEGNLLNSYANISIYNAYRNPHTGGLVADMYGGRIINCYSASEIEYTPYSCAEGQIIGSIENGKINNVYGKTSPYVLFSNQYGDALDTASFGNDNNLFTGVVYDDSVYYDLCTVLNKHVQSRNDSTWRTWQYDSIQGYPVLNESYHVTCTNVSGLRGSNVMHDGLNAIRLDWEGNSSNSYIVKCINITDFTDSVRYYNVNTNPCFVSGLNQMSKYEIYVKCNCDSLQSGWGESVTIIFDKPYWTDIVTTQPAGYMEDVDGNVTISSAEGLAWFASRVNGLNGNESFNFRNKNVSLISDVDLGQYKWMPIGFSQVDFFNVPDAIEFQGVFNGNRHTISNLYINEDADKVGFFGTLFQAKVVNVVIENSYVKGLIHVGGLCGIYGNSSTSWDEFNYGNTIFDNCHVIQSDISGKSCVGGLCGLLQPNINDVAIRNCSSSGNVSGITEFGGLIGFIAQNSNKIIENCFTSSNVFCDESNDYGNGYYGGLIGYAVNASIINCYTAGIVDTLIIGGYTGSMIGVLHNSHLNYMYGILNTLYNPYFPYGICSVENTTMFSLNENHYVLQNPITIENTTYTDLLSALNAWVDANNTEGQYRYWTADTAMVNGGFPMFATIPCTPTTGSDSRTICQSQLPYEWNGVTFNAAGTQSATLPTVNGCDSVVTMTLTVNPTYNVTDTKTICQSQLPYTWNGVTFNAAGTQSATLPAVNGCDSVVTMTLTVNPTYNVTDAKPICQSQLPYTWNGVTFNSAGTQSATLPTVNGCDSVVTMTLTVNSTYNVTDSKTICQSQLPYTWNGVTFNAAGTQSATLPTLNGCDSVVTMTLTVNPTYNVTDTKTICQSQLPYEWNGVTFTAAGTQSATLPTVNGCDSVVTMTLIVNPTYNVTDTKTICQSQLPYIWNGVTFNAAGTQSATLPAVNGCDSVVSMTLIVNPTYNVTDTKTICQSQLPYTWNGVTFDAAGTQSATLPAVNGCDSVVSMTLIVNPTYNVTDTKTICQSQLPYTWNGVTFTAAGTQSATLPTVNGCDSVVTLHLTVVYSNTGDTTAIACDFFDWYEYTNLTQSGDYTHTFTNAAGCDSVVTLHLTVVYSNIGDTNAVACDSFDWYEYTNLTQSGDYTHTFTNAAGCDSVVTLHLTISYSNTGDTNAVACDSFDWYEYTNLTQSGDYTHTFTNAAGCDSVVTLHLTISYSNTGDTTVVVCNSFDWYEHTNLTQSGEYTHTFTNAAGCDSVVTLHLTVNYSNTGDTNAIACDSFDWYEYTNLAQSGNYTRTVTNAAGCDSVVTLHLTINNSNTEDTTAIACDSFDWYEYTNLTQSGDYTHTFTNAAGCDSVVTLHLTISYSNTGDTNAVACDSFDWYEYTNLAQSGNYTRTVTNAAGCDSVVTLHLTVNYSNTGDTTVVVCNSFDWYEHTNLTQSGEYTHTFTNAAGCDSVVTLHLTVNYSNTGDTNAIACDFFDWYEHTYLTLSGDYTHVFTNQSGCDSVVTLHLTVSNPTITIQDTVMTNGYFIWHGMVFTSDTVLTETIPVLDGYDSVIIYHVFVTPTPLTVLTVDTCVNYTLNGQTYNETGDYVQTFPISSGIDSVVVLYLTIFPADSADFAETACESFTWEGTTYTISGDYTQIFSNVNGCDSVVTLHLTLFPADSTDFAETACEFFTWEGTTYTTSGDYTQIFSNVNGCDSVVTLHLTIFPADSTDFAETACEFFTWEGTTYTTSGDYTKTFSNANGCDSVVTLHLTLFPADSADFAETACESFTWEGTTYTISGDYTQIFTNVNGCDSVVTLHLTLFPTDSTDFAETACEFFTWEGTTYTTSGDYTKTFSNANGCDSVVTLHLTLFPADSTDFAETACEFFTWEGTTYTASGDYTQIFTNVNGCDSVVTLHLTLFPADYADFAETACEFFTWEGTTYTTSGDYTQIFTNVNGCDSVVTLHLTLFPADSADFAETACEFFTWEGTTYTASGDYTQIFSNVNGCDSVVTLHLSINYSNSGDTTAVACDSFDWYEQTNLTQSGDYTRTITNAAGCDSVVTLHLTVNATETSEFTITTSDSCYTWNSIPYCTSGTYTQTLQTIHGCDSIVTLHLTVSVGIDNHNEFNFNLYPNPTNGIVNIQCTNHNSPITQIHVFDAYGKLVDIAETNANGSSAQTAQIDLSGFAAGVYFMKAVADGNMVAVRKIVKK